jgi:hypothetical protein
VGVAVGEGTGVSVGITIGVGVGQAGRVGVGSWGGALHAVSATSATHPATAITRSEYNPIVFAGMVTIALKFGATPDKHRLPSRPGSYRICPTNASSLAHCAKA